MMLILELDHVHLTLHLIVSGRVNVRRFLFKIFGCMLGLEALNGFWDFGRHFWRWSDLRVSELCGSRSVQSS